MGKHTPGPWECGDEIKGESPLMVYCNDATGQRIADCTNDLTFHSREEKRANACLIAAAPEMLEALEPFKHYEDWPERAAHEMTGVRLSFGEFRKILAAIAKAEGSHV